MLSVKINHKYYIVYRPVDHIQNERKDVQIICMVNISCEINHYYFIVYRPVCQIQNELKDVQMNQ